MTESCWPSSIFSTGLESVDEILNFEIFNFFGSRSAGWGN